MQIVRVEGGGGVGQKDARELEAPKKGSSRASVEEKKKGEIDFPRRRREIALT